MLLLLVLVWASGVVAGLRWAEVGRSVAWETGRGLVKLGQSLLRCAGDDPRALAQSEGQAAALVPAVVSGAKACASVPKPSEADEMDLRRLLAAGGRVDGCSEAGVDPLAPLDGDRKTCWDAHLPGCYWMLDLGSVQSFRLVWYVGSADEGTWEVSRDGQAWQAVTVSHREQVKTNLRDLPLGKCLGGSADGGPSDCLSARFIRVRPRRGCAPPTGEDVHLLLAEVCLYRNESRLSGRPGTADGPGPVPGY